MKKNIQAYIFIYQYQYRNCSSSRSNSNNSNNISSNNTKILEYMKDNNNYK